MELFDILSDDLLVIVVILVLNRRLDLVQPVPATHQEKIKMYVDRCEMQHN